jgi:predicted metalloprotease with PDZ domain
MKTFLFVCLCLLLAGCESGKPSRDVQTIEVGSGSIRIELAGNFPVPREAIVEWVRRGAVAVTTYLGKFPVNHLVVTVYGGGEEAVGDGVTHGASRIEVRLGRFVRARDLNEDWIMTHEMFHLAFPTLNHRYLWMMEGLSDYLEPIARAQAGQWSAHDAWKEFVDGLPQGLPEPGEGGLDNSERRERIYWGGNIYWLLADVQIRARTDNRHGLDDAIRAILAEGGNGGAEWPLDRVLEVGDKATGTTVLKELYEQLGTKRGDVDLKDLWRKLGVHESGERIVLEDQAPWATIRAAITETPTGGR